jgi:integrase
MATTRTPHKRQTSPVEGASSGTTDVPGVYWYTLKSGEIRFRCMWVSSNGVPEFKRGFPTKEAAKDHRTERMAEALRGGRIHTTETFGAAFQQWLRDKRSITQGTRDGYEDHFLKRLQPVFGDLPLRRIDYQRIDEAVTAWLEDDADLAAKTINNTIGALSSFLSDMVRAGKLPQNHARLVERVSEDQIERDWLRDSKGETDRYLDACAPYYADLADFLIGTGVRISEALAVKLPDLDYLDGCVIHIMRTRRDKAELRRAAGRRSRLLATRRARGRHQRQGLQSGGDRPRARRPSQGAGRPSQRADRRSPPDLPFSDAAGAPAWRPRRGATVRTEHPDRPQHRLAHLAQADARNDAGLRDMPLHSLRHTAAALWLRAHDMEYVRRQLGHAQISTTTRIYGHLEQTVMAERAAATERRRRAAREHQAA